MLTINNGRGTLFGLDIWFRKDNDDFRPRSPLHLVEDDNVFGFEFRLKNANSGEIIRREDSPITNFSIKRSSIIQDLPRLTDLVSRSLQKIYDSIPRADRNEDTVEWQRDWILAYQAALIYVMSAAAYYGAVPINSLYPHAMTGADIMFFADMFSRGSDGYLLHVLGISRSSLVIEDHVLGCVTQYYRPLFRQLINGWVNLTDIVDVRRMLVEDGEYRRNRDRRRRQAENCYLDFNIRWTAEPISDYELVEKFRTDQTKRDAAEIRARDLLYSSFPEFEEHEQIVLQSKLDKTIFYVVTKTSDQVSVYSDAYLRKGEPPVPRMGYLCLEVNSPSNRYVVIKWDRILQRCLLIRDREKEFWRTSYFHGSRDHKDLVSKMGGRYYSDIGREMFANYETRAIAQAFGLSPEDIGRPGSRG